jgi:hypothetical protein
VGRRKRRAAEPPKPRDHLDTISDETTLIQL